MKSEAAVGGILWKQIFLKISQMSQEKWLQLDSNPEPLSS